jgi:UDP-N-acetylglucosamine 2-epimerase (non-hydrolysing)
MTAERTVPILGAPGMPTVLHVAGARPNFMKVAPLHRALQRWKAIRQVLVHTGQHYDARMSDIFFDDLGLPEPDVHLGVGSGSHAEQTARIMLSLEPVLVSQRPDLVSVVGDVNGTLAAALVAAKLGLRVAHVEAGLRSNDPRMPEELNRILVDRVSDLLFTPSGDADANLLAEGTPPARIHRVGNVMIDTLLAAKAEALRRPVLRQLGLEPDGFALCTLHRPSNVEVPATLAGILQALAAVAERLPVVFPAHPRTRAALDRLGQAPGPGIRVLEPLGYLDFLGLTARARLVLTDSGGLQEETTALGVPCLTLRENTERPVTVTEGTNTVVGVDPQRIVVEAEVILATGGKRGRIPELWDGRAAERAAAVLAAELGVP